MAAIGIKLRSNRRRFRRDVVRSTAPRSNRLGVINRVGERRFIWVLQKYAVATAKDLDNDDGRNVTLLVGADDEYNVFEDAEAFQHLIEQFRHRPG